MAKEKSRTSRWFDASSTLREAFDELVAIREEYEDWRDNLPENLQSSALYDKLEEVCNIDLDTMDSIISDCEGADLTLGFGRD